MMLYCKHSRGFQVPLLGFTYLEIYVKLSCMQNEANNRSRFKYIVWPEGSSVVGSYVLMK